MFQSRGRPWQRCKGHDLPGEYAEHPDGRLGVTDHLTQSLGGHPPRRDQRIASLDVVLGVRRLHSVDHGNSEQTRPGVNPARPAPKIVNRVSGREEVVHAGHRLPDQRELVGHRHPGLAARRWRQGAEVLLEPDSVTVNHHHQRRAVKDGGKHAGDVVVGECRRLRPSPSWCA